MNNWNFICPICNRNVMEGYTVEEIKDYIGATYNCPECNGLLRITDDLGVEDFGKELVRSYSDVGVDVDVNTAANSYMEY